MLLLINNNHRLHNVRIKSSSFSKKFLVIKRFAGEKIFAAICQGANCNKEAHMRAIARSAAVASTTNPSSVQPQKPQKVSTEEIAKQAGIPQKLEKAPRPTFVSEKDKGPGFSPLRPMETNTFIKTKPSETELKTMPVSSTVRQMDIIKSCLAENVGKSEDEPQNKGMSIRHPAAVLDYLDLVEGNKSLKDGSIISTTPMFRTKVENVLPNGDIVTNSVKVAIRKIAEYSLFEKSKPPVLSKMKSDGTQDVVKPASKDLNNETYISVGRTMEVRDPKYFTSFERSKLNPYLVRKIKIISAFGILFPGNNHLSNDDIFYFMKDLIISENAQYKKSFLGIPWEEPTFSNSLIKKIGWWDNGSGSGGDNNNGGGDVGN